MTEVETSSRGRPSRKQKRNKSGRLKEGINGVELLDRAEQRVRDLWGGAIVKLSQKDASSGRACRQGCETGNGR